MRTTFFFYFFDTFTHFFGTFFAFKKNLKLMASFGHFMFIVFCFFYILALSGTFCYFIELFHLLTLFPLCFNTYKHFFAPSGTFFPHFLANDWNVELIFYTLLPLVFFFSFWNCLALFGKFWLFLACNKNPKKTRDQKHGPLDLYIYLCWTYLDNFGPI